MYNNKALTMNITGKCHSCFFNNSILSPNVLINTIKRGSFPFFTLNEILKFSNFDLTFMNKLKLSLMALLSFEIWAYH